MSWLDRIKDKKELDKLPQRLKDATPEDIIKELAALDQLKADNEALKLRQAESDTKVSEIQTEFEQTKAKLVAAEANRNTLPPKREEGTEVTPENILSDPAKVINTRLAPLEALTIQNNAATSRMLAQQQLNNSDMASGGRTMDGRLFQAWGAEIDTESRKYQTVQLIRPEAWLGIFWYLKGTHADELRDPETRKKKYTFLEPAASGAPAAGTNGESKKDGVEGLTDQEKHVADKMNVSYENYAKQKKRMQFVGA